MVSVFLLIILFFGSDGAPKIDVEAFHTMAACKAAAATSTKFLLQENITQASVSCTEHVPGNLT